MKINKLRKVTVFVVLFLAWISVNAQTGIDSPYSRFGIGQLKSKSVNSRLHGMGGISNAIITNRFVNPGNPASYAGFDSLSFLFNAGFNMSSVTYRTTVLSEKGSNATLNYFSMGFPIARFWKSAVGLLPYSEVGYNVVVSDESDDIGKYNYAFNGQGGLNQLFIGNAFQINDNFSVGANFTYVFGKNTSSTLLYFPDSTLYANTKSETRLRASDFTIDYGIQYKGKIGTDYQINLGLTYSQKVDLNIKQESMIRSLFGGIDGGIEYILDTISYSPEQKTSLTLPQGIGFGAVFQKNNRWLVGMDFNWQNWKNFKVGTVNDSLQNAWNVALGAEFTPNFTSISKYWKRVTYRAGARYNQTYLKLYGEPINEFGISFGLSMPLPRSLTTIDLSLEVGRGGTTAKNLIQETFVNFTLGVSIYERWFVKRRYN